jgi:amino acid transporter
MLLQVWLPLAAAILLVAAVAAFVIILAGRSSPAVAQASNISLVLILAPVLLFGVLYAFLVGLSIYLVAKMTGKISPAAKVVQGVFIAISQKTNAITDKMASPLIDCCCSQ